MKKRIFCAFMALMMLIGTLSFGVAAEDEHTHIDNTYLINDYKGLVEFAKEVNNGNDFAGKTVKLAATFSIDNLITLDENWDAIGDIESGHPFRGKFDGNGVAILKKDAAKLFEYVDTDAPGDISNLIIVKSATDSINKVCEDCWNNATNIKGINATNAQHYNYCTECGLVWGISTHIAVDQTGVCASCGEKACEHEGAQKIVDNKDGKTHNAICSKCGEVMSTSNHTFNEEYYDGNCICGAKKINDCDHMGNNWAYVPNGNNTHNIVCADCKNIETYNMPCNIGEDGKCLTCDRHCDHIGTDFTYYTENKGTHDVSCKVCGAAIIANVKCNTESGECACGYTEPKCDHVGTEYTYTDNENGTHKVTCECGEVTSEAAECVYTDGKCLACGSVESKCDHTNVTFEYEDNKDGTHKVICPDCKEVVTEDAECVYTDGKCICGSECDHMAQKFDFVSNGDNTHNVLCAVCGDTLSENIACNFNDEDVCGNCGAEKINTCDHMGNHWDYIDNENGTHNVVCKDCEEVVTEDAECVYTDGKCICGAEKPECKHEGAQTLVDNGDGTHNALCPTCDEVMDTVEHFFDDVNYDGKCACGAEKPAAPVDPDDKDDKEEPDDKDDNKDDNDKEEDKKDDETEKNNGFLYLNLFNKYAVTATAGNGGTISPAGEAIAKRGESLTYTITANEGYIVADVLVDGKSVGAVTEYTFEKLGENHTISASFEWVNPFTDIDDTDAFYSAIEFVYENGLFKGVSSSEFAPMTTMSRAMFVTVLGRLANVDVEAYTEVAFDDVVAGEYYAPYVAWAVENGLAKGYGDGTFGVNDNVTIEQAIVFIARFAQLNGIELDIAEADLSSYADLDEVADWAYNEMLWAVNSGVYTADGVLAPKGAAARAIVADMLYNLCSNFTLGE